MIGLIASLEDPAALNIAKHILEICGKEKGEVVKLSEDLTLVFVSKDSVFLEKEDLAGYDFDEVVVLSRHASASRKPCMTVHVPGNLKDEAPMGGKPKSVAIANPSTARSLLCELSKAARGLDVAVSLEATHHGPTELNVPVTFIEIGSDIGAWKNEKYGRIIAEVVLEALPPREKVEHYVGFGGPHYAPKHTRFCLENVAGIGHIVPKYAIDMDENVIAQLFQRTVPPCEKAVLDWKGIPGSHRSKLLSALESLGVECLRI